MRIRLSAGSQAPVGGQRMGLRLKQLTKCGRWQKCLTAPGAWAAASPFPAHARSSRLPSKQEQSDPLLRMLLARLIWGLSFHTFIVQRGVNCTDLGEAWLSPPQMPERV